MKALTLSDPHSRFALHHSLSCLDHDASLQPLRPNDKESPSKSDASSVLEAIFLDSGYESNSNPSEDEDDSDDSDDDPFHDEGQLPLGL